MCDVQVWYEVPSVSRLLEIIGLFCKRALSKRPYSAKETYNFKEPTNRSHPIRGVVPGASARVVLLQPMPTKMRLEKNFGMQNKIIGIGKLLCFLYLKIGKEI